MVRDVLQAPNLTLERTLFGSICKGLNTALVVGSAPLRMEGHRTITLEVGNFGDGCVDWQLLVVHAETMTMGVWVREQTGLKDRIGRRLDVWNEVRW